MQSSFACFPVLGLVAALAMSGCTDGSTAKCVPGTSAACACAGNQMGAQVCNAQGTFDVCSCAQKSDAAADETGEPPAADGGVPPRVGARKLDLLLMVDNSPSMQAKQDVLRRNFSLLLAELRRLPGGLPDLHLGVVSSDLGAGRGVGTGACSRQGGDRGILQTKPTCGLQGATFLTSEEGGTRNNFSGDIAQAFSCMADLGIRGCGYEHQLQATRVALFESITPENVGFLRRDALLGIVLLTDEDDCSADTTSDLFSDEVSFPGTTASFRCAQAGHVCNGMSPPLAPFQAPLASCQSNEAGRLIKVRDIVESIRSLKQRPDQEIVVAGIFGWPSPAGPAAPYRYVMEREGLDVAPICDTQSHGVSYPGLRLKQFVDGFGASGSVHSACENDLAPALQQIGQKLAARF